MVKQFRDCRAKGYNGIHFENDIFSVSDTGILGKRNSEFSQQESNLRPSDYKFGRSTTELQETRGSTYRTWSHGGLQFYKELEGEIARQHIEGASGCRFSPYVISPNPPTQTNPHKDQTTTPGTTSPTLCEQWVGSLTSHRELLQTRVVRRDLRFVVLIRED